MPPIVAQTEANRALRLFGDAADAGYRDDAPRDGIDDRRANRLLAIAEAFSPILRRNNFSVPLDFARVAGENGVELYVDTWMNGRLVARDSTRLLSPHDPSDRLFGAQDTLLASLVRAGHPGRGHAAIDPAERRSAAVLYVDMPGFDEGSWRRAYRGTPVSESRIYAHPFLERQDGGTRLVLQYWFFYPFNDGPNNHEGDWEHVNVVLAWPRAGREQPDVLSDAEIARLLDTNIPLPLDSLEIGFVEYYFHESMVVLDYQSKSSAQGATSHPFEDADWLAEVVAQRRAHAGGRLARHPVAYIGANPTGPDELFDVLPRFALSYNRNPHGTYPAPGLWQRVGAMGSTERVHGPVVPEVHENTALPWTELIADSAWLVFPADRIILVPDWERVADLALEDEGVRRRWAWLFLPIRFGFPVARSPGAGLVPHADVGNIAPEGPAFQPTWNRLTQSGSPHRYEPTVVRVALVSTTPWMGVQSGWGAFNMPIFAAGLMPGYNVLLSQVMPWLTSALAIMNMPPPRTYYRGALPARFSSIAGGGAYDVGGDELAMVMPEPTAESAVAPDARARPGTFSREAAFLNRLGLTLYDGRRLSVENTFDWGSSRASGRMADSSGVTSIASAELHVRELRGGFRYALLMLPSGAARIDARAGYGWMRVSSRGGEVARDDLREDLDDRTHGYLPSLLPSRKWWPNSWWLGAAAEVFTPRNRWLGRTVGYGIRLESAFSVHRLEEPVRGAGRYASRVTTSCSLVLGW